MLNQQMNVPVRPSTHVVPTSTPPVSSMVAFGAIGSPSMAPTINAAASNPAAAAAAAAAGADAIGHPRTDPQQQQYNVESASWWSPGMSSDGAMGYDDTLGTYSYGEDFVWQ